MSSTSTCILPHRGAALHRRRAEDRSARSRTPRSARHLRRDQYRRHAIHAPTIGILLCTGKAGPTVRYALAATSAPVAVADYYGLPADARAALPSAEELQAVVHDELDSRGEDGSVDSP